MNTTLKKVIIKMVIIKPLICVFMLNCFVLPKVKVQEVLLEGCPVLLFLLGALNLHLSHHCHCSPSWVGVGCRAELHMPL